MFNLIPLIVLFPVVGLLINAFFGRQFRDPGAGIVASIAAGSSFVIAVLEFVALLGQPRGATVKLADWIVIGNLSVPWAFKIDTLSVTMMLVVTGVGTLIHIYAIGYMKGDERFPRFFVYLNLFLASMLVLVTGDNYLMLFVGWELVGLCSYLLIGFWFDRESGGLGVGTGNAVAAKKAFVVNRVGDFGFLLGMFLIFWTFGTFQFDSVFGMAEHLREAMPEMLPIITAITLLLLVGATGKSAQIPLYVWLPDAMAGPTPVSALIHAATMVTAGVYMITRSAPLYNLAPASQVVVALIGASTALLAGTIAVGQFDIKRVLAYSTISQLGFMIAAVGLGAYVAGMFHLVTHAFFKALLFLASGSVIHGLEHGHPHASHQSSVGSHQAGHQPSAIGHQPFDPQDMRNMGGLRGKMKVTFWVYTIGALTLAGILPLAGFWSKDEILADAWRAGLGGGQWHGLVVYLLLAIAAFFTAFYMGRQIFMVFFGEGRTDAAKHASESAVVMLVPLVILAGLSVLGGALNLPGLNSMTNWLKHTSELYESGDFNIVVAVISTVVALAGIALSAAVYYRKPMAAGEPDPLQKMGALFVALNCKWWVDELYGLLFIRPYIWLSRFLADVIDWRFWHDWFHDRVLAAGFNGGAMLTAEGIDLGFIDRLANGLAELAKGIAARFRRIETGYVRNYALGVFIGAVAVLAAFLLSR
ncbi:MAG: NADH-quinone oxidoreductase subunit L [Chloroflexi bacterium]|nr:NADH-quinone oxidoreductase subunit L [Chloroflexota bacterium]